MARFCAAILALSLTAIQAHGQSDPPLSAIDWLTESLTSPPVSLSNETPSSTSIDDISVEVLADRLRDGLGVLSPEVSGLPFELWRGLESGEVARLINGFDYGGVPAAQKLFQRVLLSETDVPLGSGNDNHVLIARIDKLLKIGALEEADALISVAGVDNAPLFRRWFDISLLTHNSERACDELKTSPMLAPTRAVQVFCLALGEEWDAAATALTLGEQLGDISVDEADLLSFFLDSALLEEMDPPPYGMPMSSLEFLIRESVGLPRPNVPLPIAFMHAELADFIPVRFRMEAAERLVKAEALPANVLFSIYREEVPAASGGIWERAHAVQEMDAAASGEAIASAIAKLDSEMSKSGLRTAAAREFLLYLSELPPEGLPAQSHDLIAAYLLLAGAPEIAGNWITSKSAPDLKVAHSIATGEAFGSHPISRPFQTSTPETFLDEEALDNIKQKRVGATLISALGLIKNGDKSDSDDRLRALAMLIAAGQEQSARKIVVETLLIPMRFPDANQLD